MDPISEDLRDPQESSSPIPSRATTSISGHVFAFRPPTQPTYTADVPRFLTASSTATEPPVVTPPTGLPLSELASFNGFRKSSENVPSSLPPQSSASIPPFAFQPSTAQSNPSHPTAPRTIEHDLMHNLHTHNLVARTPLVGHEGSGQAEESDLPSNFDEALQLPSLDSGARDPSQFERSPPSYFEEKGDPNLPDVLGTSTLRKQKSDLESGRDELVGVANTEYSLPSSLKRRSKAVAINDLDADQDDLEDSPYAEVRASVSNTDDPEMPCLTFRVWLVGILLCVSVSAANIFFTFRSPSLYLPNFLILLLAHPCGLALAWFLPIKYWVVPHSLPLLGGWEFSLNPSPWNIKEHTLVLLLCTTSTNPAYGLNVIVVMEKWYNMELSVKFTALFLLSTQLLGLGLAGVARPLLIWPASFIWPQSLVFCATLNSLHAGSYPDPAGRRGISRARFFGYVTTFAALYSVIPGFLFTALSYFSVICWIWPRKPVINQLFGTVTGLGMGFLTFDWAQISWRGSPLMYPFWAQANIMAGFVIFYWIIAAALYYSNIWKAGHLPISGTGAYDRFAQPYNITRILTQDKRLNATEYNQYSPVYLPATFVVTYMLAFIFTTAIIVHTALCYSRQAFCLLRGAKAREEDIDVHARLMKRYPKLPSWYYHSVSIISTIMLIIAVKIEALGVAAWVPLVAVILAVIYMLPNAYMLAMTAEVGSTNLILELVAGRLLPGSAIGNMVFKTIGVQGVETMLSTCLNLKIAHYVKCPEKPVFTVQIVGCLVGLLTQVIVKATVFARVPDICDSNLTSHFTCPGASTMYTASIFWGLIGPDRVFGTSAVYRGLPFALIIGAVLPFIIWLRIRRHPHSRLRHVHIPVLIIGPTAIPPATGINYSSWFLTGFIFQYWIRRKNFRWWSKYNYVLSAALDTGLILGSAVVFLALELPRSGRIALNWWGNTIWTKTADFQGVPYYETDPVQGF